MVKFCGDVHGSQYYGVFAQREMQGSFVAGFQAFACLGLWFLSFGILGGSSDRCSPRGVILLEYIKIGRLFSANVCVVFHSSCFLPFSFRRTSCPSPAL